MSKPAQAEFSGEGGCKLNSIKVIDLSEGLICATGDSKEESEANLTEKIAKSQGANQSTGFRRIDASTNLKHGQTIDIIVLSTCITDDSEAAIHDNAYVEYANTYVVRNFEISGVVKTVRTIYADKKFRSCIIVKSRTAIKTENK